MASGNVPTVRTFASDMAERLDGKREYLAKVLPAEMDVDRFLDVAKTAFVQSGEELRKCEPDSVYMAIKRCAQAGLMPDGDESTIVRYGSQAQWMPMVKGIIRQMLRVPDVAKVEARVVRQGDDFAFAHGLNPRLEHTPQATPSGEVFAPEVTHSYAVVFWTHLPPEQATFEVMARPEIEEARQKSKSPESPAWKYWYDQMARKTALHRVSKYVDLSPEARRAIQVELAEGWGSGTPISEGTTVTEKLEEQARERTDDLRHRMEAIEDGDRSDSEPEAEEEPEPEPEPEQDGPREPTDEEKQKAEEARRANHLEILSLYRRQDRVDAADKLFGGADDVPKTDAGLVAVEELSTDRLASLSDELTENFPTADEREEAEAEEQDDEDDGDE